MTPLREKMIKAMELRTFGKNTQRGYLGAVKGLATFYRNLREEVVGVDGVVDERLPALAMDASSEGGPLAKTLFDGHGHSLEGERRQHITKL